MKTTTTFTRSLALTIVLLAGSYIARSQGWTQKTNFALNRTGAVGFSIGSKGYAGLGENAYGGTVIYKDLWEYDPIADAWTQRADFGGVKRTGAVGFSIGSKGYVGTGKDATYFTTAYKDFWEYDPSSNTWMKKADVGGYARCGASGFSIGNKGYIGTGCGGSISSSTFFSDFWEYDPSNDTWTKKEDYIMAVRNAVGFSIGNKGYFGTGLDAGNLIYDDFVEYDPAMNKWTSKATLGNATGQYRYYATGFSISGLGKGYIGAGCAATDLKDFWEYDQVTDIWTEVNSFDGNNRESMFGFSIGNKGYVGTGIDYDKGQQGFKDFWELTPASVSSVKEHVQKIQLTVFPNPSFGDVQVKCDATSIGPLEFILSDAFGRNVFSEKLEVTGGLASIHLGKKDLPGGNYIYTVSGNGKNGKFITTEKITILR